VAEGQIQCESKIPEMPQGLRINEVRVVFQQGSDDFRELIDKAKCLVKQNAW
jgi:hypothetical protein